MSTGQSIHPLGYGDTDEIDPVVAEALTTYQVEWLFRQCEDLRLKNSRYSARRFLSGSVNIRNIVFLPALLGTSCALPSRII
jgi:hypothetical protein